MSQPEGMSGPQFRGDRPAEPQAVRTTIVGGRPSGSGQKVGPIPRGIEILLRKASVDPAFKELLLRDRGVAAETIGLSLDPAETAMLAAIAADQLEAIIAQTVVPPEHRRVFLGKTATTMLAVLGASVVLCSGLSLGARSDRPPTKGIRPDRPEEKGGERADRPFLTGGSRPEPDHPPPPLARDSTEPPGPTRGIRPDRPEPKQP